MAHIKLKDVINRVQTKVDKDNTSLIYYVGGEHIESENVCITKRGLIEGSTIGPMFYYGFKAGDFLLVSRNPHLKKAGVVGFDGICSEKTFVLATANSEVLLPEYLPFILQNDTFWEYAYQHRHGSTNTFINWSTLANYEFELPNIEIQRKLAEILWAINDTMESYKRLILATDELVKSQFIEWFGSGNPGNRMTTVEECCASINGGGTPSMSHPEYYGGDIPFIKSGDVKFDYVSKGALWLTSDAIEKTTARLLPAGTVLVVVRSAALKNEFHVAIAENPLVINQDLKALQPKDGIVPEYLMWAIKSREHEILQKVQTMLTSHIEIRDILNLPVKRASTEEQAAWKAFVRQSDKSKFELEQALSELTATYKRIISEQLG